GADLNVITDEHTPNLEYFQVPRSPHGEPDAPDWAVIEQFVTWDALDTSDVLPGGVAGVRLREVAIRVTRASRATEGTRNVAGIFMNAARDLGSRRGASSFFGQTLAITGHVPFPQNLSCWSNGCAPLAGYHSRTTGKVLIMRVTG